MEHKFAAICMVVVALIVTPFYMVFSLGLGVFAICETNYYWFNGAWKDIRRQWSGEEIITFKR